METHKGECERSENRAGQHHHETETPAPHEKRNEEERGGPHRFEREQPPDHSAGDVVTATGQRPTPDHDAQRDSWVLAEVQTPAQSRINENAKRCHRPPDAPAGEDLHAQPREWNKQSTEDLKDVIRLLWAVDHPDGSVEERMNRRIERPADDRLIHFGNNVRRNGIGSRFFQRNCEERISHWRLCKRSGHRPTHLLPLFHGFLFAAHEPVHEIRCVVLQVFVGSGLCTPMTR